jgi:hypothetical protein
LSARRAPETGPGRLAASTGVGCCAPRPLRNCGRGPYVHSRCLDQNRRSHADLRMLVNRRSTPGDPRHAWSEVAGNLRRANASCGPVGPMSDLGEAVSRRIGAPAVSGVPSGSAQTADSRAEVHQHPPNFPLRRGVHRQGDSLGRIRVERRDALGPSITQDDINNGRLICFVGVAPVRPTKFVIFRIQVRRRLRVLAPPSRAPRAPTARVPTAMLPRRSRRTRESPARTRSRR